MPRPHAVLLAAGPAQRLLPLTEHRPKGMLLIGGKPLLQHAVEALREAGIASMTIVVGAHGEKIQSFFKDGSDFGVQVRYAHQPEPTGTMDAVRRALEGVEPGPLWILPGHAFVTARMLAPLARGEGTLLLLATAGDIHVQGVPAVRGDRLQSMRHTAPVVGSTRVSTNILRAGPGLVEAVLGEELAAHKELDLALGDFADRGGDVRTAEIRETWFTVVEPWDVLRLNERVLDSLPRPAARPPAPRGGRGPLVTGSVHVGKNTQVAASAVLIGPATIGDGCSIGDHAVIGPYVSIRNNTVVGAHAEIRRAIVNNNVVLDSRCLLRGSIVDDGADVGPGFLSHEEPTPRGPLGCILGRDTVVGPRVLAMPGAVLEPEGRAEAGSTIPGPP